MKKDEIDIVARTIYGEARGEYEHKQGGIASLIAVGNVIMNRLQAKSWYGNTARDVCLKPWQFSCWNEADPNRNLLLQKEIRDPVFRICRNVAIKVAAAEWPDLTKGSNHYHALSIPDLPKWAAGQKPKVRLGGHVFYFLIMGN